MGEKKWAKQERKRQERVREQYEVLMAQLQEGEWVKVITSHGAVIPMIITKVNLNVLWPNVMSSVIIEVESSGEPTL